MVTRHPSIRLAAALAGLAAAPGLAACVSASLGEPVEGVFDLRTGRTVAFQSMVEDLATVPMVFVGESHTNPEHHEIQRRIVDALSSRNPRVMVGLEMLQRPYQDVLDRWSEGGMDEGEFLREVHWFDQWSDWDLYAPILRLARDRRLRGVGLHLPDLGPGGAISREIAKSGLDGLPPWMRARLPAAIDTSNRAQRAALRGIFQSHPGMKFDEQRFDRFIQSQCTWDETMAESTADALAAAPRGSAIVVLAGSMHVKDFYPIPERARRRNGLAYRTVLPMERDSFPEGGLPVGMGRPADYVLFTGPSPEVQPGRVGLGLRGGDSTVNVVAPGSAAEEAGIRAGDVLLSVDGHPILDEVDLRVALDPLAEGAEVRLRWRRGDEVREAAARLRAPPPMLPPAPAPKETKPAEGEPGR